MSITNIIKDIYKDYFKIGVACEKITERFTSHEIGNPDKENLMIKHFNSMTFANELKPAYNMGFHSPDAKEDYLPFVINPQAKAMLDFAKEHGFKVRAHVLVWHSQCPKEIFCKNYEPVTFPTDPELLKEKPFLKHMEKLKPECYVDRATMLERLNSYINSVMEYMYKNGYASTIYAWDVVNEAIELADKTPTGLRNSYWYQVIGDDFIYYAFRYARDAVDKYSALYASEYGVDASDADALKTIQPVLVYNDYNEFMADKKQSIIDMLNRSTSEHGSIISENLLGGIGMQGHVSDNNDIDEYIQALRDYAAIAPEVHITELDVKCTCTNSNREYYQAIFYQKLFTRLLEEKKAGNNLTSVTFWGLTDDNSWIRGADPLLFHGDLTEKRAFDGLVFAVNGGSLGEPELIFFDLSDRFYDFAAKENKDEPANLADIGFKMRGFGQITLQSEEVHSGKFALAHNPRFDGWSSISFDASDFIGQTIEVSAYVKSEGLSVSMEADINGKGEVIAEGATKGNGWVLLKGTYEVPNNIHALTIYFNVHDEKEGTFSPLFVDDVALHLIELKESFEKEQHIAAIRGAGHLPMILVTDKESVDGKSHSLLVTRQEKDATVKLNISSYIGYKVKLRAFVKTADSNVRIGLDGATPLLLNTIETKEGFNEICAEVELSKDLNTAEIYIETNGNADFFVDDFTVALA